MIILRSVFRYFFGTNETRSFITKPKNFWMRWLKDAVAKVTIVSVKSLKWQNSLKRLVSVVKSWGRARQLMVLRLVHSCLTTRHVQASYRTVYIHFSITYAWQALVGSKVWFSSCERKVGGTKVNTICLPTWFSMTLMHQTPSGSTFPLSKRRKYYIYKNIFTEQLSSGISFRHKCSIKRITNQSCNSQAIMLWKENKSF